MTQVKVFWDPAGFAFDSLGRREYLGTTDGDTLRLSVNVRLLGIDTPEMHYPGRQETHTLDGPLAELAGWLETGQAPISPGLAAYLGPKLATERAGTLQEEHARHACAALEGMLAEKLNRPGGKKRGVFVWVTDPPFDRYGRLLAYLAPTYDADELSTLSRGDRATFNLRLVESGWAATFLIFPGLPGYSDLVLLQAAAAAACAEKRGAWTDALMLTGYEFRMCVRLHEITKRLMAGESLSRAEREGWVARFCADLTTMEVFYPQDYYRVVPCNRLFIEPGEINEAVGRLNLRARGDETAIG